MIIKILLSTMLFLTGCGGDLASDKFYQKFKVVNTVACWEDDVYDVVCKTMVKDSNNITRIFKVGEDYPIAGEFVYRECWEKSETYSCFVPAQTKLVRDSYREGGRRYD